MAAFPSVTSLEAFSVKGAAAVEGAAAAAGAAAASR